MTVRVAHGAAAASRANVFIMLALALVSIGGPAILVGRAPGALAIGAIFAVWIVLRTRRVIWRSEVVIDREAGTLRAEVHRFPWGQAAGTAALDTVTEVRTLNAEARRAGMPLRTTAVGIMRRGAPAMIVLQEPATPWSVPSAMSTAERLAKELGVPRTGN